MTITSIIIVENLNHKPRIPSSHSPTPTLSYLQTLKFISSFFLLSIFTPRSLYSNAQAGRLSTACCGV
ncbi:hypothetical protein, partial [Chryseobacterium joostei]